MNALRSSREGHSDMDLAIDNFRKSNGYPPWVLNTMAGHTIHTNHPPNIEAIRQVVCENPEIVKVLYECHLRTSAFAAWGNDWRCYAPGVDLGTPGWERVAQGLLAIYNLGQKHTPLIFPPIVVRMIEYIVFTPVTLCETLVAAPALAATSDYPLIMRLLFKVLLIPGMLAALVPCSSLLATAAFNLPSGPPRVLWTWDQVNTVEEQEPVSIVRAQHGERNTEFYLILTSQEDPSQRVLVYVTYRDDIDGTEIFCEVYRAVKVKGPYLKLIAIVCTTRPSRSKARVVSKLVRDRAEYFFIALDTPTRRRDFFGKLESDPSFLDNIETLLKREEHIKLLGP